MLEAQIAVSRSIENCDRKMQFNIFCVAEMIAVQMQLVAIR